MRSLETCRKGTVGGHRTSSTGQLPSSWVRRLNAAIAIDLHLHYRERDPSMHRERVEYAIVWFAWCRLRFSGPVSAQMLIRAAISILVRDGLVINNTFWTTTPFSMNNVSLVFIRT